MDKKPTLPPRGFLISEEDELIFRTNVNQKFGLATLIQGNNAGRILEVVDANHIAAIFTSMANAELEVLKRAHFIDLLS